MTRMLAPSPRAHIEMPDRLSPNNASRRPFSENRVMQALDAFRPFAGFFAALARAFAAPPARPPDADWDEPARQDARLRADAGFGPGEFEPRLRRGVAAGPAGLGPSALPVRGALGL